MKKKNHPKNSEEMIHNRKVVKRKWHGRRKWKWLENKWNVTRMGKWEGLEGGDLGAEIPSGFPQIPGSFGGGRKAAKRRISFTPCLLPPPPLQPGPGIIVISLSTKLFQRPFVFSSPPNTNFSPPHLLNPFSKKPITTVPILIWIFSVGTPNISPYFHSIL